MAPQPSIVTLVPRDVSPEDNVGPALVIVASVLTVVSLITTVLRLWVRWLYNYLGWDDYTMALAMALSIVETVLDIKGVQWGKGRHDRFLSSTQQEHINMYSWIAQIVLFLCLCLLKCSICLLMMRIRNTPKLKWSLIAIMIGLALTNLEPIIVLLAQCRPVSAFWRPRDGSCWDPKIRIYSIYLQAAYSVVTDLICSLLPILVVWNVKLPMRQKIAVCALMSVGLVATACAAVRAASLAAKPIDITYTYGIAGIWSVAEINLGIIAANLAPMRAVFTYCVRGTTPNSSSYGSKGYGYGTQNSRSGYMKSGELGNGQSSHMRRPSSPKSEESEIPLEPGVKKTTDFYISDADGHSSASADDFHHGRHGAQGYKPRMGEAL